MERFDAVAPRTSAVPSLEQIVNRYDLNEHPFYRAWREGTLPRASLAAYAAEYAPFIRAIEAGWRTLGEAGHADVEREHSRLWGLFCEAIGASADTAGCAETRALAAHARDAFRDEVEAVGALYAFEAQQPKTSRSKLDGLHRHYAIDDDRAAYFHVHADDYGEKDLLAQRAAALPVAELARVEAACTAMCRAMWSALDGVLASTS